MAASNTTAPAALDLDELKLIIDGAQSNLRATKDSAKKAAAHVYMVWLKTSSGLAKNWLDKEISERNEKIDGDNVALKTLLERSDKFMKGEITDPEDRVNKKYTKDVDLKIQAEEIAQLKAHAAILPKDRPALYQMRCEAREGTSKFTKIIKFVFEITSKRELDCVNRYAHALEWIEKKFEGLPPKDVDEISDAIEKFGGFEAVVQHQRLLPPEQDENGKDREAISEFILEQQKQALKIAQSVGDVSLQSEAKLGEPVLLLGRYMGGKVEIVGEAGMSEADVNRAISNYGGIGALSIEPEVQFVGRMLDLAEIVEEGQEGLGTHDGTAAGTKVKSQRAISLLVDEESPKFVVSARHAEVGLVVHATPKDHSKLVASNENLQLIERQLRRLSDVLSNEARRKLISLTVTANPVTPSGKPSNSPMAWNAVNVALISKGRRAEGEGDQIMWSSMSNVKEQALDIDGFRPNTSFPIHMADIEAVYVGTVKAWTDTRDGKKGQKIMRWDVNPKKVTFSTPDTVEQSIPASIDIAGSLSVTFRIKDMIALFKALRAQKTDIFECAIDNGGLMSLSWQDDVGSYAIHVPLVGKDKKLQSRRVAPMRPSTNYAMAAE